jgi:DNA polymerase-3 subunit delta'
MLAAGTHPDLHLIFRQLIREHPDAESRKRKGLDLGVDVIRNFVIDRVGLTPNRGRAKVFILRNADEMNIQAQNALLKTLEEPPGPTFLILLASALEELLPTTQSRCQVVRFNALPPEFVRARFADLRPELTGEALEWYAAVCEGSLGRALNEADNDCLAVNNRILEVLSRGTEPGAVTETWMQAAKGLGDGFQKQDPDISEAEATRRGLRAVLRMTANWYADLLRTAAGRADDVANAHWRSALDGLAPRTGPEAAAIAIQRIARAERQLDLNVNTELCVESLAGELAALSAGRIPTRV